MVSRVICVFSLIPLFVFSQTEERTFNFNNYYISPGAQFGYCFGHGITWSCELSVGWLRLDEHSPHLSVSFGYQHLPGELGSLKYINTNAGVFVGGLSMGKSFFKSGIKSEALNRLGFYTGLGIGFVQYERIQVPRFNRPLHVSGVWGKIPLRLPIDESGFDWQMTF